MKLDKQIVITGAAGFIGSQLLRYLNERGYSNITIFDDITAEKLKNINQYKFFDYLDKDYLLEFVERMDAGSILLHLGGNSNTTCRDKSILEENSELTSELINICQRKSIKMIYASSASVYGNKKDGSYQPLNLYAFSKMLIDKYVESLHLADVWPSERPLLVGLRFFNVVDCGKGHIAEAHKGGQASVVYNWWKEWRTINDRGQIRPDLKIFRGENLRDFVSVEDVCSIIEHFMNASSVYSGIYDVGSGEARNFWDIANIFKKRFNCNFIPSDIPKELKQQYQTYTCANLEKLRKSGYDKKFTKLENFVNEYIDKLEKNSGK